MARRKADRSTERGERRAETAAVAAYLTALRAQLPARSRDALEKRRAQVEQWIAEESSPIREVELIQQRLDIDAQLAQIDQAARLPELEEAFVNVAASWAKRSGITAARCARSACPLACLQGLASEPGRNQDAALASRPATNVFVAVVSNWRDGFKFAWQQPDPEPEGPGLVWRETGPDFWSGSWHSQPRGTVMLESSGRWVAYLRLEDPPGLSPIATVGRFATVDEAMVATDEVWAARGPS